MELQVAHDVLNSVISKRGMMWEKIKKLKYPKIAEHLVVPLRGNETFDELLKIEQQVKEHKERQERIAEQNANIQRVDAQTKKYWGK